MYPTNANDYAIPTSVSMLDSDGQPFCPVIEGGFSRREEVALRVLQGLHANSNPSWTPKKPFCEMAFEEADAFLAASNNLPSPAALSTRVQELRAELSAANAQISECAENELKWADRVSALEAEQERLLDALERSGRSLAKAGELAATRTDERDTAVAKLRELAGLARALDEASNRTAYLSLPHPQEIKAMRAITTWLSAHPEALAEQKQEDEA